MRDRVPTKPNRYAVYDDSHNFLRYEYHERADEPTQAGTPLNKANLLSDPTEVALWGNAQDRTVSQALRQLSGASAVLLYEKYTAGTFDFTVPAGVTKLGVLLIGGGGSGAARRDSNYFACYGGASGVLLQVIMTVTAGEILSGVIGGGGAPAVTATTGADSDVQGLAGSSSSFGGLIALGGSGGRPADGTPLYGGQAADRDIFPYYKVRSAPFGGAVPYTGTGSNSVLAYSFSGMCINLFDVNDKHIWCGAGGLAGSMSGPFAQTVIARARGSAGVGAFGTSATTAPPATAPGDGGGGCTIATGTASQRATSGAGAPGCILIYDLTGKEAASV